MNKYKKALNELFELAEVSYEDLPNHPELQCLLMLPRIIDIFKQTLSIHKSKNCTFICGGQIDKDDAEILKEIIIKEY